MSILIDNLVEELISGLKHRLQSHEHSLDMENEKILKNILLKELRKPSIEQARTPTQIVNNCLLYTSPSPRDATLSRMPSSA